MVKCLVGKYKNKIYTMKKLLLLLLFIPLVSFGQDYGNDIDALKLCTVIQNNSFISEVGVMLIHTQATKIYLA